MRIVPFEEFCARYEHRVEYEQELNQKHPLNELKLGNKRMYYEDQSSFQYNFKIQTLKDILLSYVLKNDDNSDFIKETCFSEIIRFSLNRFYKLLDDNEFVKTGHMDFDSEAVYEIARRNLIVELMIEFNYIQNQSLDVCNTKNHFTLRKHNKDKSLTHLFSVNDIHDFFYKTKRTSKKKHLRTIEEIFCADYVTTDEMEDIERECAQEIQIPDFGEIRLGLICLNRCIDFSFLNKSYGKCYKEMIKDTKSPSNEITQRKEFEVDIILFLIQTIKPKNRAIQILNSFISQHNEHGVDFYKWFNDYQVFNKVIFDWMVDYSQLMIKSVFQEFEYKRLLQILFHNELTQIEREAYQYSKISSCTIFERFQCNQYFRFLRQTVMYHDDLSTLDAIKEYIDLTSFRELENISSVLFRELTKYKVFLLSPSDHAVLTTPAVDSSLILPIHA